MKTKILILSIAAILPTAWALAQDAERPPRPPGAPRDGDRRPAGPRDGERPKGDGPRDGEKPRGQRPPGPMPMPFLKALDADEDGIISADEIKGAPAALKKLDKNDDGKLTREEWQPMPPPGDGDRPPGPREGEAKKSGKDRPSGKEKAPKEGGKKEQAERPERPQGPPPSPLLETLDADRDGTISADEIAQSSEALEKLDQNKDGQLGPREYGPRPPQGPPPQEGDKDGAKPAQ